MLYHYITTGDLKEHVRDDQLLPVTSKLRKILDSSKIMFIGTAPNQSITLYLMDL